MEISTWLFVIIPAVIGWWYILSNVFNCIEIRLKKHFGKIESLSVKEIQDRKAKNEKRIRLDQEKLIRQDIREYISSMKESPSLNYEIQVWKRSFPMLKEVLKEWEIEILNEWDHSYACKVSAKVKNENQNSK